MTAIDEIKSRLDVVDLISESVKLRRAGKNYTGFCPFHPNSRTPAFVVFPDSGTWRCFGQCNEGGDIFKFVMKKEGWDFPQALKYLAERAGVQLEPLTPEREAQAESYEHLRTLLEDAATFYRHNLFNTPAGASALAYLHKRGLKDTTIETFGLGYAPDAWDAAATHFMGRGYTQQDLIDAGLVTERDSGGVYDRFRNRITFPIREMMGKMAGFGARILDPNDNPKFLNSPQTVLFDKGRLLYGLDQARKSIRTNDQAVIVEGYLDVIALHQGGFTNTVSPMGTALTEDQMRLLKRFTRRIVLALDPDAAGEKATLRGLEVARQAMDHAPEVDAARFDPRGLVRQEARLQADLRVTTLPEGMDPDEVVNRDPQEWAHILDAAQPVVIHVMEALAKGRNLDDPKTKSELAAQILPLIEDVPNPIERDAYRQRLARLIRVDERVLVGASTGGLRARPRRSAQPEASGGVVKKAPAAVSTPRVLEGYLLSWLLNSPELLYQLDRMLQEAGLYRVSEEDFALTDDQGIFRTVAESLQQMEEEPKMYIAAHLTDPLDEAAHELTEKNKDLVKERLDETSVVEDLFVTVCRVRKRLISDRLTQLIYLQRDAQEQGDSLAKEYQQLVLDLMKQRDRLDMALNR
jgi:DNA primase